MRDVGELCLQCGLGFGRWFGEVDVGKPSVRACNVSDRREMFIWLLCTLAKVPCFVEKEYTYVVNDVGSAGGFR